MEAVQINGKLGFNNLSGSGIKVQDAWEMWLE